MVSSALAERGGEIEVFTTRPDTLFGATYMVLSPEHPLVCEITTPERRRAVEAINERSARSRDLERTELNKEKTGVFTGAYAINPVNDERIPIWIADYVLMGYGTGAIMAVPAHDERDFEFAKKFGLEIRRVVREVTDGQPDNRLSDAPMEARLHRRRDGRQLRPADGLPTPEAKDKIVAWLEQQGLGRGTVNYKLRDWLFSRQRYWGEPFPIVWEEGAASRA